MPPYYNETPFERIVDVHWKKKDPDDDDCGPPRAASPQYSGFYGYGVEVGTVGQPIVSYGPHQYPGCVGWSAWSGNVIGGHDCGGIYTYQHLPPTLSEGITLTGAAYTHQLMFPYANSVAFTNNELWYGPFDEGQQPELPAIFWIAPLSGGETYLGCFGSQNIFAPWVPNTIRMNFAWVDHMPDPVGGGSFNLGLSFLPLPGDGTLLPYSRNGPPPNSGFVIGRAQGGEWGYGYDTHFWEWFKEDFTRGHHYDSYEDWDFSIGGPVELLWHFQYGDGSWRGLAGSTVISDGLSIPGDWLTWEVIGECGPAFGPGDIGGPAAAQIARTRPPTPPLITRSNDHRLVRPGPPLCGEASGFVYPPLDPQMLETILALEKELANPKPLVIPSRRRAS